MARAHLSTKLQLENEALVCDSAVIVTFIGNNCYSLVFAGDVPNSNEIAPEVFAKQRLDQAREFIADILKDAEQPKQD
jgi:hypothetical protein